MARVGVFFNEPIKSGGLKKKIQLTNLDTGEDVTGLVVVRSNSLLVIVDSPVRAFECKTTYQVTIRGVRSVDGTALSGVGQTGATFENGTVSWTFSTQTCPA